MMTRSDALFGAILAIVAGIGAIAGLGILAVLSYVLRQSDSSVDVLLDDLLSDAENDDDTTSNEREEVVATREL